MTLPATRPLSTSRRRVLAVALAAGIWLLGLAGPLGADTATSLEIVGFAPGGERVLFRETRAGGAGGLVLVGRDGRRVEVPSGRIEKRPRPGTKLRRTGTGLAGAGMGLALESSKQILWLSLGSRRVAVWNGPARGSDCPAEGLEEGRVSADRLTVALVLRRACGSPGPLVVSLAAVTARAVERASELAHQGKLKPAAEELELVLALRPRFELAFYRRACVAALGADERATIAWLGKLKALRTTEARRLLVRARFDGDYRLVRDSKAVKDLLEMP
jgi:hypothetical protein